MQCGFLLQSDYDATFLPGKKKEKSDLKPTKPSLHSPEFYFQGIQRFETQLFLQRDYAVNVRTTKLVLFFFFFKSGYWEQLKSVH